jgi:hypothetical protein
MSQKYKVFGNSDRKKSANPFSNAQQIKVQFYTKQVKNSQDDCYFRQTLITDDGDYLTISPTQRINFDFIKSITQYMDERGETPTRKLALTCIKNNAMKIGLVYNDENIPYDVKGVLITPERILAAKEAKTLYNIIYKTVELDERVIQQYKIESSFTNASKGLLNKISKAISNGSLDNSVDSSISLMEAKQRNPDGSYSNNTIMSNKNTKVFNTNVFLNSLEGGKVQFCMPLFWEKPKGDDLPEMQTQYTETVAECREEMSGIPMNKFWRKYIDETLKGAVNKSFLIHLERLGYELIEDVGKINKDGSQRLKYLSINGNEPDVDPVDLGEPDVDPVDQGEPDDDLPF